MSFFEVGLASVTFRNKNIEEIVSLCENANVDCIEWGADVHVITEEDAKRAKNFCDKAKIRISSYGSYYRVGSCDEKLWLILCQNAKTMGAESIRVWLGEKNSEDTSEHEYNKMLTDLKNICYIAEKHGLMVCPECHDYTFNNDTDAFLKIRNELDMKNFRTYFQSRYFRMTYDLDRIDRTYDFIENIHVSYSDMKREQKDKVKDKNYLDTLLKKFREKGFGGAVILEFTESSDEKSFFEDIQKLKTY